MMSVSARLKSYRPLRRKVAIRRDGEGFVIAHPRKTLSFSTKRGRPRCAELALFSGGKL
jgi:hypothetical protein